MQQALHRRSTVRAELRVGVRYRVPVGAHQRGGHRRLLVRWRSRGMPHSWILAPSLRGHSWHIAWSGRRRIAAIRSGTWRRWIRLGRLAWQDRRIRAVGVPGRCSNRACSWLVGSRSGRLPKARLRKAYLWRRAGQHRRGRAVARADRRGHRLKLPTPPDQKHDQQRNHDS
jgi:hypothetical protein